MTSPSVKLLRTQSDDRLVALAAAGHERAFEAIVERYRRPLLRHCRRYLPEARAEDALQQALVSAWSALRRGDDVRELRPWLYRIVHNTSLNTLRAAGYDYEQLHDTLHGGGGPAELAERSAVVRQTLAGLAALPERQRDALLRIAVEGRSQDEVAEELGLSHGAVRQLVHRARTSLRTAATALLPLPLAGWLAAAGANGRGDLAARIGELVAGAGGGATLAKAGVVAALAGGAVGGPAVVGRIADGPGAPDRAAAIAAPARADDGVKAHRVRDVAPAPAAPVCARSRGEGERRGDAPGGEDHSGPGGGDAAADRSGRGGGEQDDRSDRSGDDRSGPGGGGHDERDDDRPVTGGDGEDRSGASSPDETEALDDDAHEAPAPLAVDESSGSGTSGSGTSGSGTSGSGTGTGTGGAEEPDDGSPGPGSGELDD